MMLAGVARADRDHRRTGRLHLARTPSGTITTRRRIALVTRCGFWMSDAWAFKVDANDPVNLCLRCYPQANPFRRGDP